MSFSNFNARSPRAPGRCRTRDFEKEQGNGTERALGGVTRIATGPA